MFAGFGCTYAFGAFFISLETEFQAARAEVAAVFSYAAAVIFIAGAFSGPLSDRIGAKPVVALGTLGMMAGLWMSAQADSIESVSLWFMLGMGGGLGFVYVPAIGTVQRWFFIRRGMASGLAVTGIGLGTFLMPVIAGQLLLSIDWRHVFEMMAMLIAVLCFPALNFLDSDPLKFGLHPDGAADDPRGANPGNESQSLREILLSRAFIQFYIASVILSFAIMAPFVHLAPYAVDAGVPGHLAATLVGCIGIGSTIGRLLVGGLADRFGRLPSLVALFVAMGLAYLWWLGATTYPLLVAFAIFYGTAYGGSIALMPAILADYFGGPKLSSVIGLQYTSAAPGSLGGPIIAGAIFDYSGSYSVWLVAGAAICVTSAALMATTPRPMLATCTANA